jgi:hypothetical protein
MKNLALATLAVAAMIMPFAARADESPSPQQQQLHQSLTQLHQQARTAALAALTPEHRTLLDSVVAQLANDPNRKADMTTAARTLDSALTPTESQSILKIASDFKSQAHKLMQSSGAQPPNGPAEQNESHGSQPGNAEKKAWNSDAGYVLLRMALPHHERSGAK